MITYTFFGEPVSFNEYINAERTNKFRAAKIKKTETETIALELIGQNAKPIKGKIDLLFKIYAKDKRRDPDSYILFYKFFLDGMQAAGIIPNDNQLCIGSLSQDAICIDALNPRVEVIITQSK